MKTILNLVVCGVLLFVPRAFPTNTAVIIVPQIAAGSFDGGVTSYNTVIQIANQTTVDVEINVEVFEQNGTPSNLTFHTDDLYLGTFTGVFGPCTLPPNHSVVITSEQMATGKVNWARVTADRKIIVSTVFEIRYRNGTLISRVGVPGSASNLPNVVIPRMRDVAKGIQTAFAIVNTGADDISVTANLYSRVDGFDVVHVVDGITFSLTAGSQTSQFFNQLFAPLNNEPIVTSYSHVVLEPTAPTLAATSLVYEGSDQATLPVTRLDGSPASSGTTVSSPVYCYFGNLLLAMYESSRTVQFLLEGEFIAINDGPNLTATALFRSQQREISISLQAKVSGTGRLDEATFSAHNSGFDGVNSTASGSATGIVDGGFMNVTFLGTETWSPPSDPTLKFTRNFLAMFLESYR